jgi:hypothetical protein
LRQLKQLIDPSLLPKVVSAESKPVSDGRCRLAQTFSKASKQDDTSTLNTNHHEGNSTAAPGTGGNSSVAGLLVSSPENRSVMQSVSRLVGSLYGNEGEKNQGSAENETHADHHHGDEFHPAETDDDEEDSDVEDHEENAEEEQQRNGDEGNPAVIDGEEEDGQNNDQASSDEDNIDDEEDDDNNHDEEDEEIESDEMEEDEEIIIHEDDFPDIEESLLEIHRGISHRARSIPIAADPPSVCDGQVLKEHSRMYVRAAMKVLSIQHPAALKTVSFSLFPISAEKALVTSILNIVKPEKKPFAGKICLRRAPTQDEYFAGSLSRNPVSFSMLSGGESQREPTVRDLRQHIASELQMADSAEMLELLIANKILDVNLKLRVVCQTVWKEHCIQLTHSSSGSGSTLSALLGGGTGSILSSGSGLSLMVTSSLARSLGVPSLSLTADSLIEHFPPMIITYRLTGVDGEATEDTVSSLSDPEAPSEAASPEDREKLMEEQFGITRLVTQDRGVVCLLRSLEASIADTLRKIRRDSVGGTGANLSRQHFNHATFSVLNLLLNCANLSCNRRLLLNARSPTTLLRLLLDVLHCLEAGDGQASESNPTAKSLKELIEVLASDITLSGASEASTLEDDDMSEDASTLRVLIQAIETSSLSPPLRNIIAKLLPYLTYGKPELSKELATEFMEHITTSCLGDYEIEEETQGRARSVLMDTFIHASISLPPNQVCDCLRMELLNFGFIERIVEYIFQNCPTEPAPWHAFLWPKEVRLTKQQQLSLECQWKAYLLRPGLKSCFDILVGLSKEHRETQAFLGEIRQGKLSFLQLCHWLESTSDNASLGITLKKLALVAEALLDDLAESDTSTSEEAKLIRRSTRERKKEIAMERRKTTMNKFGSSNARTTDNASVRDTAASLFAPVLGLFSSGSGSSAEQTGTASIASVPRKRKSPSRNLPNPTWMDEMEDLVDETGLVCSVCQEGIQSQPTALLGLYCYVRKVALSSAEERANINGASLLTTLPSKLPASIQSLQTVEWYQSGRAAGNELREEVKPAIANRRRDACYTTTVSALNAIHIQCHARARQADRNHPKAPKSEWEGASLRNSRVNCNVILPLVSSRSSQVSLQSTAQALADHQSAVANMIGMQPKSNLWNVLYDVRLLLLRMAYGESLNAECGGGSLLSNTQLIFYQLSMAKSFDLEAQVDSPTASLHARALSAGFLAGREIISSNDYDSLSSTSLIRGIADSAVIAALTSILFHNTKADGGAPSVSSHELPHPKRRWVIGSEQFLRGLINCAGCRHALGIVDSGCISGRRTGSERSRSMSFAGWAANDESNELQSNATRNSVGKRGKNITAGIEDFGTALRPFLVFYAMLDQLSSDYTPDLDDPAIEASANRLVQTIESCYLSKNIHELLEKAKVTLSHAEIIKELQRGMTAA